MGYEFECQNVIPGCGGRVEGDSPDEVLGKAAEHAADVHGMTDLPDEVVEKVKASIVSTG